MMFGTGDDFVRLVQQHSGKGSSSVYVVLHSTNGVAGRDSDVPQRDQPFQIADDIWICRLPKELSDKIYDACESPGVPPLRPHRQYGQLYTFAIFAGPWLPGQYVGQRDVEMNTLVSCAQLVHQTTLGFANSAKLDFDSAGKFLMAVPHLCRGITEQAFTVSDSRNWLSESECEEIRELFRRGFASLPDRVARANWHLQHAFFQSFFEVRSLLVVTGLEALVHIHAPAGNSRLGPGSTAQFVQRTVRLATLLDIPFSESDARYVYEHRSDISHGRDPWSARIDQNERPTRIELSNSLEVVQMYLKAEHLLQAAIRRAMTDAAFADIFKDDARIAFSLQAH